MNTEDHPGSGTKSARLRRGLGALRHVALAVRHEHGTPGFHLARADLHLKEGNLAECIEDYRIYLELVGDDSSVKDLLASAHVLRAKELDASGHHERALDDFNGAISLAPTASHYSGRAGLHERLGNHAEAAADYDRALEIDPGDWAALNGRYEMYRDPGGLELARDYFRDMALYKGSALHHYCLGRVYFALGDFEGAVNCLTVAIVTDQVWPVEWPSGHNPHLLRGVAHLMLADCEAAASDRVSEIEGDADDRAVLLDRFGAGREAAHYQWALEDFKRIAGMRSGLLDVYQIFGDTQIGGGDAVSILRAYENMVAMYPEEGRTGEMRARARRRLERIIRQGDPSGSRMWWPFHRMPAARVRIAGTALVAGAIAAYVALMYVELVPTTLEFLGELSISAPMPVVWGGLTVAAAVVALGFDRAITVGRSIYGGSE